MASERAQIEAELTGAGKVASDAKKIGASLKDAKKEGEGVKAGAAGAAGAVGQLGTQVDGLRAKISPQAILGGVLGGALVSSIGAVIGYLGGAADKAQSFGERTSAVSRRTGVGLADLRSAVAENERATLQSADAQLDYVEAVERTSYGGRGAVDSLRDVGAAATASGRKMSELVPLVTGLQTGFRLKGDVGDELERITYLAQRLGTQGGVKAFQDSMAALAPSLANVSATSATARADVEALVATLQKTRSPQQAQAVASGAISMIKGRSIEIERTLGREVLDEQGNVKDPVQVLADLRKVAERKYGKNKTAMRRATISEFGADLGSAVLNTDLKQVKQDAQLSFGASVVELGADGKIATSRRPGPAANAELEAYRASREGQREERGIRSEQRERSIGDSVLSLRDAAGTATDALASGAQSSLGWRDTAGREIKLSFPPEAAKAIGGEVAAALRAQPPVIRPPLDPNREKGQ